MSLRRILGNTGENWGKVNNEKTLEVLSEEFEELRGKKEVYESSYGYFGKDEVATRTAAIVDFVVINGDESLFIEQRRECSPVGNSGNTRREVIYFNGGKVNLSKSYKQYSRDGGPVYKVDGPKEEITKSSWNNCIKYFRKRVKSLIEQTKKEEIRINFYELIGL